MNLDRVEAILRLLQRSPHVGEVRVEGEGEGQPWKLKARKWPGLPVPPEAAIAAEAVPAEPERVAVTAGRVGVFHALAKAVAVGDAVKAGGPLGSIDAMGILNPVTGTEAGTVAEVLVEDGDPVEYGQRLFLLDPHPDAQ